MSELPNGWSLAKLGDDVEYKKGKKPRELYKDFSEELLPYIDIKAFEKKIIRQYAKGDAGVEAKESDSLMVWDGARSGLVGNGINGVIGSTLMRIRPIGSKANYLHYFLEANYHEVNSKTKGTGIPHVDPKVLWELEYPIAPANEQTRIANKLDSLLAKVQDTQTRLEKIPGILKRFRQSVLAAATCGELTKEWREVRINGLSNSYFKQRISEYDGATLSDLPDTWCFVPFHVAAEIKSNLVDPKLTPEAIHLAPNYIESNNGRLLDLVTVAQDDVKSGKHKFYAGQIVYSKIRPYLNKVCLVDFDGLCSADMYPISANIESEYLLYCMLSTQFVDFTSRQQGRVVLPKINQKALNAVPVPVASEQEQKEIVGRVESLFALADKAEEQYQAAKQRTDCLAQSLLAKAFRGELVPQDPNDEPAFELLKRIQAEREVLEKTKPKHKKHTKAVNNKKKTTVSDMKLENAPEYYLTDLLKDSGGEAAAKELWSKSRLPIDDFYAQLKQEMSRGSILDEQPGRDPQLRKLKLTNKAAK